MLPALRFPGRPGAGGCAAQVRGADSTASVRRAATCLVLAAACLLPAARCAAAPEEIQVYTDDLTEPGRFGLDLHGNEVISGDAEPGWPGAQSAVRRFRLTPEFYYGLSRELELGLYLLGTRAAGGDPEFDGSKVRLKYIPRHDDTAGAFWGVNTEVGRTSLRVAENPWNAELKGIAGVRRAGWLLAANLDLDRPLGRSAATTLGVDLKASWERRPALAPGIEYYGELGTFGRLGHLGRNAQTLYAVLDSDLKVFRLNAGLGRALTGEGDRWVVKFILGVEF